MFYIFNKDKLVSYVVTVFTIIVLFFTASVFKEEKESIQTSSNEIKADDSEKIENNIDNIDVKNNEILYEN